MENQYERDRFDVGTDIGGSVIVGKIGVVASGNGRRYMRYRAKCRCGAEFELSSAAIIHGNGRHSCPKCRKDAMMGRISKKVMENQRLFSIWRGMKWRCERSFRGPSFLNYRGRGISVCKEWSESFDAFCDWALANGYASNLTIDRINVDGNYEPDNCRWADWKIQSNNKRPRDSVKMIMVEGVLMPVVEAAEKYHISPSLAFMRLKRGWTAEKTFGVA